MRLNELIIVESLKSLILQLSHCPQTRRPTQLKPNYEKLERYIRSSLTN